MTTITATRAFNGAFNFFQRALEVAAEAANKLQARYPKLSVGHYSPPFHPLLEMDHDKILRRIRAMLRAEPAQICWSACRSLDGLR